MERKCKHYDTRFIGRPFCGYSVEEITGPECNRETCGAFEIDAEAEEEAKKTVKKPYEIICGATSYCEGELNRLAKKFKVDIIGIKNRDLGRLLLVVRKTPL